MAFVTLNTQKLKHNYHQLNTLFKENDINWSVVTKMLCGRKPFLREILTQLPITQICDSRITNLKKIKEIRPDVETIYIKPPAKRALVDLVQYADVSFNTSLETVVEINAIAASQKKTHQVMLVVELGELREGILGEDLLNFVEEALKLPHVEIVGLATNLSCINGVLPSYDKLVQLLLYKELIETKYGIQLKYISGGSSVTIGLIKEFKLPKGINHFRVGETLYFGTSPYFEKPLENFKTDLFKLHAEVIEIQKKPYIPEGIIGKNLVGEIPSFSDNLRGKESFRALIDVGILDIDSSELHLDPKIGEVISGSSDIYIVDLKNNPSKIKVGDTLEFNLNYMAVVRLLNSKYIDLKTI